MSRKTDEYFKDVPMKSYDLIKEGLIVFGVVSALIIVLAIIFSSPDYPTVTAKQIATYEPISYLRTFTDILLGKSEISNYGPPYDNDVKNAQSLFGIAPAKILGTTIPINAVNDFVIDPLSHLAVIDKNVQTSLDQFKNASPQQRQVWIDNYSKALDNATVVNGKVQIVNGDYGPLPVIMNGLLLLGKSGLLEGALQKNESPYDFYNLNYTKPLLLFQGKVYHSVAKSLNMLGEDWGIANETGNYPGAWWLWPYTFFYQIPPMSTSPNGDLEVGLIMIGLFLVLLFLPVIPILNKIPKWVKVYRIIWRDWYKK
ncbi:MAG: hypothetical protein ACP5NR_08090 [Athalassotoga sp.]|uniref:hypothetical protein n=1 Tax=Athalassotoga sp. TaxID=2022597 RepID=UPI003D07E558